MTDVAAALASFFGGFGMPAYARNSVPDGAKTPYITYEIAVPPPLGSAELRAWLWFDGAGFADAFRRCGEVMDALRDGGRVAGLDAGFLVLLPGTAREIGGVDGRPRAVEMTLRAVRS